MLKISIVIPVYQSEDYLEECLESIVGQTCNNFEVILINDGSTDRSEEICKNYVNRDDRFRLISQENRGTVQARLRGVREARFEWIMFVDSDDWIDQNALELLNQCEKGCSADVVVSTLIGEWENKKKYLLHGAKEGVYKREKLQNEICSNMVYDVRKRMPAIRSEGCGKLFRKDILLDSMEGIDSRITKGDDFAFVYPSILRSKSLAVMGKEEAFYHYRQKKTGLGKQQGKNLAAILAPLYEYMEKEWKNDPNLLKQLQFHKLKHCKLSMEREFEISQKKTWEDRIEGLKKICRDWEIESLVNSTAVLKDGLSFLDCFILEECLKRYFNIAGFGIILQKIIQKGKNR